MLNSRTLTPTVRALVRSLGCAQLGSPSTKSWKWAALLWLGMRAARCCVLACLLSARGAHTENLCRNLLHERMSRRGALTVYNEPYDCVALAERGECRFAGHYCDLECNRCGSSTMCEINTDGLSFIHPDKRVETIRLTYFHDESIAAAYARFSTIYDSLGSTTVAPGFAEIFGEDWTADAEDEFRARMPTTWAHIRGRVSLGMQVRLNIGGHQDCHPMAYFWNFACVGFNHLQQLEVDVIDDEEPTYVLDTPWHVHHDLTERLDLPDGVVDEILCEHVRCRRRDSRGMWL